MTHVFIINPAAGQTERIKKTLFDLQVFRQRRETQEIQMFVSEEPGHATRLAERAARQGGRVRIYACGGDGTLNEVLQGVVGFGNVELGCVPIGSGNDFIKNFNRSDFLNFEKQLVAPSVPVDVIDVSGEFGSRYAINAVSLSWDSRVAIEVEHFKKIPAVKGSVAYALSVASQLIKREPTRFSVELDGESFPLQEYMIGMCANGAYYGGGFQGAPFAKLNDGLFELILVESVTRREVARLFPAYQKGKHLTENHPAFQGRMVYRQGHTLTLTSPDDKIPVTIDGEGYYTQSVRCQIVPNAVRLIVPDAQLSPALVYNK